MNNKHALCESGVQRALCEKASVITGAPRSGTTLAGKIISTFNNVAYQFEPPSMYQIYALYASNAISLQSAASILRVYLSEDLLLEQAHGRGVNLRPGDDSLILNSMTWSELLSRWQNIRNRDDAIRYIEESGLRLVAKMPNIMDGRALITETSPAGKHVLVSRNGFDVIASIVKKGWVSDEGLTNNLWPYVNTESDIPLPYWLPQEYWQQWPQMSEFSRASVMWIYHMEMAIAMYQDPAFNQDNLKLLNYEQLLDNPKDTVCALAEFLETELSSLSHQRIAEIRPGRKNDIPDLFKGVDSKLIDQIHHLNDELSCPVL